MATSKVTPGARVTIPIKVETQDNAKTGARKGTFTAPWPKTQVKVGDVVRWQAAEGQTFVIRFTAYDGTEARSPFSKIQLTDKDDYAQVVTPGDFHYKVSVIDPKAGKFAITHCPEFSVGN
jgi:hypothetical protein